MYAIELWTWHQMKIVVRLNGPRTQCERFCETLKVNLRLQIAAIRSLKPFLNTFFSEALLADRPDVAEKDSGLGWIFEFPGDAKKYVLILMLMFDMDGIIFENSVFLTRSAFTWRK
jgi:hypothetical protein